MPVGLCGVLIVDEPRVGTQRALERVEVVRPPVRRGPPPLGHLGAGRAGDLERRLVAGRLDDDVVAGLQERVVGEEDALLGGGDDNDIVGAGRLVDRGDRGAQLGRARRLRVAEPLGEKPLGRVRLEGEEVGDGDRLGVARGEHVRRRELVHGVVLLDPERRDLHGAMHGVVPLRDDRARPRRPRRRARPRAGAARAAARRPRRGRRRSRSTRRGSRRRAPAPSRRPSACPGRGEHIGGLVRRERREQREPERAADLLRGVEQARREPGVVDGDAARRDQRHRHERQAHPDRGEHDPGQDVGDVGALGREPEEEQHPDDGDREPDHAEPRARRAAGSAAARRPSR